MNRESIRKIFLFQGVMIGFIGTLGGFLLAFAIYYIHQEFNIYPLDASRFRISAMPMELHWADFLVTGLMSFFLSVISSLYPAKRAAESDPLQAIRYE
jgi:lipoprotein-releasing system permease protein